MRIPFAFALFAACFCGAAMAQTTANPVVEHFRAYRAAMERGDLAAASSEAEQALAASQARDGDGGRTAVLALNLASVRLLRNDAATAVEPAQRALTLSQNAGSGVDPRLASLVLGRAQLGAGDRAGAERLSTTLTGSLDGLPEDEIYSSSMALGVSAAAAYDGDTADAAYDIARAHADGSPLGHAYGYGVARTGQAAARFVVMMGPRGTRTASDNMIQRVREAIDDAVTTLKPFALWTNAAPTIGERAYADAVAWQAVLDAKVASDRQGHGLTSINTNEYGDLLEASGAAEQIAGQCGAHIVRERMTYPPEELHHLRNGVVIILIRADASGAITSRSVLSSRGADAFPTTVQAAWSDWRLERNERAPSDCRLAGTYVGRIFFVTN